MQSAEWKAEIDQTTTDGSCRTRRIASGTAEAAKDEYEDLADWMTPSLHRIQRVIVATTERIAFLNPGKDQMPEYDPAEPGTETKPMPDDECCRGACPSVVPGRIWPL
jgi:hypothetical protein